jgi:hypothetical protein
MYLNMWEQREVIFLCDINWLLFFNRADGVNCAVRIDSLNTLQVSFRLETGIPNLGNLVCSAGNLEANYLTT